MADSVVGGQLDGFCCSMFVSPMTSNRPTSGKNVYLEASEATHVEEFLVSRHSKVEVLANHGYSLRTIRHLISSRVEVVALSDTRVSR